MCLPNEKLTDLYELCYPVYSVIIKQGKKTCYSEIINLEMVDNQKIATCIDG